MIGALHAAVLHVCLAVSPYTCVADTPVPNPVPVRQCGQSHSVDINGTAYNSTIMCAGVVGK